jgi:5'-3' exonuclease
MRAAHSACSKKGGDLGSKRACFNAKAMLYSIIKEMESGDYKCYLGTPGDRTQHRFKIFPAYKANRANTPKPKYFTDVYNYIKDNYNTEIVEGIETDDILSIEQRKHTIEFYDKEDECINASGETCICTIDKDLNIVPGWHYNFVKKEKYWMSELDGLKCLYKQILSGDVSDGIPRIKPKVVLTKWYKQIDKAETEQDIINIVRECLFKIYLEDFKKQQYEIRSNNDIKIELPDIDKEILWRGQILYPLKERGVLWNFDHLI